MTLENKYQKVMKEVRLSEGQKDDILRNVLAQQEQKKNTFGWLKPLGLTMVGLLLVLSLWQLPNLFSNKNSVSYEAASAPEAVNDMGVAEVSYEEAKAGGNYEYSIVDRLENDTYETTIIIANQEVYIVQAGQEAYWKDKNNQIHHLKMIEPINEAEFKEFIEELIKQK